MLKYNQLEDLYNNRAVIAKQGAICFEVLYQLDKQKMSKNELAQRANLNLKFIEDVFSYKKFLNLNEIVLIEKALNTKLISVNDSFFNLKLKQNEKI